MPTHLNRWTQLGLGAALAGGTLAACGSPDQAAEPTETEIAAEVPPAESSADSAVDAETADVGPAEAGEGEGGVVITEALTDPVVFLSILAITDAHIIAARDAHALGEIDAAAGMFAHPVSEVLFESADVFAQLGVEDFSEMLTDTSTAIYDGETPEQISARADAIGAAMAAAAEKAPASDSSAASIAAGVTVDQLERAADMYRIALETDAYEPYLDGYGFFKAGESVFLEQADGIEAEDPAAATAIKDAITTLEAAYPSAGRQDALPADLAGLTVAVSNAVLAVQN